MTSRPRGSRAWILDFVLLGAVWGASFLFMRLAVVDFGPMPTAALRVGIASLFLVPLLLLRGLGPLLRTHWRKVFAVGALNSGIPFALYAFAVTTITTGLSAILNATVPLFGAVVAWLWLKDRPAPARAVGLAVGFAGVAMLAWDKASFRPGAAGVASGWAVLACLLATLCYGIAASATKKHLAGLPPLVTATGSQLGATVALIVPALWSWPAATPGPRAWLALLALGTLCTGVAYILYFRLIEEAGPSRALAVTFLVPAFAVLYGLLFLGERVTPWMVVCAGVIVCGTALSTGLLRLPQRDR
ncbi:DMT family transporter [Ramlibacter sp.]|uniref:DMT family transporter n=1 Tax=Ramlibacter sp. TaxID=1917967 RepID=UPI002D78F392|nr:DMT family transporter [Ramlibacter sp.]